MRNQIYVFTLMIFVIFIMSCSTESNSHTDWEFEYPLTIGNNWQYNSIYEIDYDENCEALGYQDKSITGEATVQISSFETILDSLNVFNFETTYIEEDILNHSKEYYNKSNNSFICYAYDNSENFTPKNNNKKIKFKFNDKLYDNIQQIFTILQKGYDVYDKNSIVYDPSISLQYPFEINNKWISRQSNNPWKVEKEIIGKKRISLPAGEFDCWEIQWTFPESDWNNDIDFRDYVSKEGLIKRIINYNNIEVTNNNNILIGYSNDKHEIILLDYN